jgi:TRAP-type C4-dicarboxylate transport system substrate-binding protein
MSRFISLAVGALAAAMVLPAAPQVADAKDYLIRYSDIGANRGPRAAALNVWKEEIEKESKGQLKIKFFWGQSLMKSKATLKGVGSGLAEMGTVIAAYTPADMPVLNYGNVPFNEPDPWVGIRAMQDLRENGKHIRAEEKKNKIRMLFQNVTGPVHLLCGKEQVDTLEKLKGKKIRAIGGYIQLFKSMGAVPVKIGFGELYSALDRGTVDCTVNYTVFVKSYKHYEVTKYLMLAGMGQSIGYGGAINLKFYNSLPQNLKDILDKASDRYMDNYGKNLIEDSKAAAKEMAAGIDGKVLKFVDIPQSELDRWAGYSKEIGKTLLGKMKHMSEADRNQHAADFEAAVAKYRKIKAEKGYPWER